MLKKYLNVVLNLPELCTDETSKNVLMIKYYIGFKENAPHPYSPGRIWASIIDILTPP